MRRLVFVFLLIMGMVSTSLAEAEKQELARRPLVRWSPDGQWIATVYFDGIISVTSLSTPSQSIELTHEGSISDMSWDASSGRLATATHADGTIRIWDAKTGSLLSAFQSEATRDGTIILSWNSKQGILASLTYVGDGGFPIRFWDTNAYVLIGTTVGVDAEGIGWSPDGTKLAISGYIHGLRIYDTFVGNSIPFKTQGVNALRLAWSPDSTRIAALRFYIQSRKDGSGSWDVYTWSTIIDASTLQEHDQITQPNLNNLYEYPILWSPDGERVAILNADHIDVIDAKTGVSLDHISIESPNYDAAWSPFGGHLAIVGASSENAQPSNVLGVQLVVPAPSFDLIENIESACVPADVMAQLPDAETDIDAYIVAVEQNGAIAPACAADLVAVAEAMGTEKMER